MADETIKTENLNIRVTPEQKKRAKNLADSCNMTVSELVVLLLESAETKPIISYEAVLK